MALSGELRSQEEFEIRLEMFLTQILVTYLDNRETLLIALREFEQLPPQSDASAIRELIEINHSLSNFVQKAKDRGFVREDVDTDIVSLTGSPIIWVVLRAIRCSPSSNQAACAHFYQSIHPSSPRRLRACFRMSRRSSFRA